MTFSLISVTSLRFWVAGVSIMSVDALGIFGNLISLITLSTMTKRGLFIKLLVALTIFDILFLLSGKYSIKYIVMFLFHRIQQQIMKLQITVAIR